MCVFVCVWMVGRDDLVTTGVGVYAAEGEKNHCDKLRSKLDEREECLWIISIGAVLANLAAAALRQEESARKKRCVASVMNVERHSGTGQKWT